MRLKFTILKEIFSSSGVISSKRVVGSILVFSCIGCIIYLVATDGGTPDVCELVSTSLITGAALLGVSNITSIWKGSRPEPPQPNKESNKSQSEWEE